MKYYVVYRHYDQKGSLLYVGMTSNLGARNMKHKNRSHWFTEIANIRLEWFSDKREAKEAEASAICSENPIHNKNLRHGNKKKVCIVSMTDQEYSVMSKSAKIMGLDLSTYIRSCGLLAINEGFING